MRIVRIPITDAPSPKTLKKPVYALVRIKKIGAIEAINKVLVEMGNPAAIELIRPSDIAQDPEAVAFFDSQNFFTTDQQSEAVGDEIDEEVAGVGCYMSSTYVSSNHSSPGSVQSPDRPSVEEDSVPTSSKNLDERKDDDAMEPGELTRPRAEEASTSENLAEKKEIEQPARDPKEEASYIRLLEKNGLSVRGGAVVVLSEEENKVIGEKKEKKKRETVEQAVPMDQTEEAEVASSSTPSTSTSEDKLNEPKADPKEASVKALSPNSTGSPASTTVVQSTPLKITPFSSVVAMSTRPAITTITESAQSGPIKAISGDSVVRNANTPVGTGCRSVPLTTLTPPIPVTPVSTGRPTGTNVTQSTYSAPLTSATTSDSAPMSMDQSSTSYTYQYDGNMIMNDAMYSRQTAPAERSSMPPPPPINRSQPAMNNGSYGSSLHPAQSQPQPPPMHLNGPPPPMYHRSGIPIPVMNSGMQYAPENMYPGPHQAQPLYAPPPRMYRPQPNIPYGVPDPGMQYAPTQQQSMHSGYSQPQPPAMTHPWAMHNAPNQRPQYQIPPQPPQQDPAAYNGWIQNILAIGRAGTLPSTGSSSFPNAAAGSSSFPAPAPDSSTYPAPTPGSLPFPPGSFLPRIRKEISPIWSNGGPVNPPLSVHDGVPLTYPVAQTQLGTSVNASAHPGQLEELTATRDGEVGQELKRLESLPLAGEGRTMTTDHPSSLAATPLTSRKRNKIPSDQASADKSPPSAAPPIASTSMPAPSLRSPSSSTETVGGKRKRESPQLPPKKQRKSNSEVQIIDSPMDSPMDDMHDFDSFESSPVESPSFPAPSKSALAKKKSTPITPSPTPSSPFIAPLTKSILNNRASTSSLTNLASTPTSSRPNAPSSIMAPPKPMLEKQSSTHPSSSSYISNSDGSFAIPAPPKSILRNNLSTPPKNPAPTSSASPTFRVPAPPPGNRSSMTPNPASTPSPISDPSPFRAPTLPMNRPSINPSPTFRAPLPPGSQPLATPSPSSSTSPTFRAPLLPGIRPITAHPTVSGLPSNASRIPGHIVEGLFTAAKKDEDDFVEMQRIIKMSGAAALSRVQSILPVKKPARPTPSAKTQSPPSREPSVLLPVSIEDSSPSTSAASSSGASASKGHSLAKSPSPDRNESEPRSSTTAQLKSIMRMPGSSKKKRVAPQAAAKIDETDTHTRCNLCNLWFLKDNKQKIRYHVLHHCPMKAFQCRFCNYSHHETGKVKRHQKNVHKRLDTNDEVHNYDNPLISAAYDVYMKRCFPNYDTGKLHIGRVINYPNQVEQTYECTLCKKKLQKGLCAFHIVDKHIATKVYNCTQCKYKSIYKRALVLHLQAVHSSDSTMEILSNSMDFTDDTDFLLKSFFPRMINPADEDCEPELKRMAQVFTKTFNKEVELRELMAKQDGLEHTLDLPTTDDAKCLLCGVTAQTEPFKTVYDMVLHAKSHVPAEDKQWKCPERECPIVSNSKLDIDLHCFVNHQRNTCAPINRWHQLVPKFMAKFKLCFAPVAYLLPKSVLRYDERAIPENCLEGGVQPENGDDIDVRDDISMKFEVTEFAPNSS